MTFEELGERAKRRRIEGLTCYGSRELLSAASSSFKSQGERGAVSVLESLQSSPTVIKRMSQRLGKPTVRNFTAEEALALILSLNLGVAAYKRIRNACTDIGHDIFPSYYEVGKLKKSINPPQEIVICEKVKTIESDMQSLLDRTVESIAKIDGVDVTPHKNLTLISKWGGDGSSGHSLYKMSLAGRSGIVVYLCFPLCH